MAPGTKLAFTQASRLAPAPPLLLGGTCIPTATG